MRPRDKETPPQNIIKGVNPAVIEEAEQLARHIAGNERAMNLLRDDNEGLRKRLERLFDDFGIPELKIDIVINTNGTKESYIVKKISTRGFIPVINGMQKMLSVKLKSMLATMAEFKNPSIKTIISDTITRKDIAKEIAEYIAGFLRKDAILVTEMRKKEWGQKLEEDKAVTAYLLFTRV